MVLGGVVEVGWHWLASFAFRAQLGGRELNGFDNLVVARAAAQIARDALPDLVIGGAGVIFQKGAGAHHHARRAQAALPAVLLPEPFLERMELPSLGDAVPRLQG